MKADSKKSPSAPLAEPSVGFAPVPLALVLLGGLLFFAGQLYLDRYAGGFHPKVYAPYESWEMVQDLQPKGADDLILAKGKRVYDTVCVACHQGNGAGAAGLAPPLAGSEWVVAPGPNRLIRIIHMGLRGPITVKGVPYDMAMPSMGRDADLSAEDIAAVASYIRNNPQWGNNASIVKPEEVTAVLESSAGRSSQWTAEELLALPENP